MRIPSAFPPTPQRCIQEYVSPGRIAKLRPFPYTSHQYEDRGVFGKHGATRQQFRHKSDSGSVRSQSRTRSAGLVTCSIHYAAYPGLVSFVSGEPDLYPIWLPPF